MQSSRFGSSNLELNIEQGSRIESSSFGSQNLALKV